MIAGIRSSFLIKRSSVKSANKHTSSSIRNSTSNGTMICCRRRRKMPKRWVSSRRGTPLRSRAIGKSSATNSLWLSNSALNCWTCRRSRTTWPSKKSKFYHFLFIIYVEFKLIGIKRRIKFKLDARNWRPRNAKDIWKKDLRRSLRTRRSSFRSNRMKWMPWRRSWRQTWMKDWSSVRLSIISFFRGTKTLKKKSRTNRTLRGLSTKRRSWIRIRDRRQLEARVLWPPGWAPPWCNPRCSRSWKCPQAPES